MTYDPHDSGLSHEEFRALRATIRERGHLRLIVSLITFVSWAMLLLGVALMPASSLTTMVPLVVLAAGFEVVFATHVGVERIGRYLAAHYETNAGRLPAWERTAMVVGQDPQAATGIDPLFARIFGIAMLLNLIPLGRADWSISGISLAGSLLVVAAHLGFAIRLVRARQFAQTQRGRDAALFERAGL